MSTVKSVVDLKALEKELRVKIFDYADSENLAVLDVKVYGFKHKVVASKRLLNDKAIRKLEKVLGGWADQRKPFGDRLESYR
jgi:hypothetical protein